MIKNMLSENTDYEYISKITGKTIDEIKRIEKNELKNTEYIFTLYFYLFYKN